MSIDPLAAYTDIQKYDHINAQYDLPKWLKTQGYKTVKAFLNHEHSKPAPAMFFTCVEAIKRILGLHHRSIITPYQLYRFLQKHNTTTIKGE